MTPQELVRTFYESVVSLHRPEDLPRVFEKGFTGYNGRTDKKASGIGLYLCRRILRALNHDIEINSAPGAGTVVRIRLQTRQAAWSDPAPYRIVRSGPHFVRPFDGMAPRASATMGASKRKEARETQ